MEHNSIKNLIEILKSQASHYELIKEALEEEKSAITSWDHVKIRELNESKEQLAKKESLLEEARKTIALRIKEENNLPDDTVITIIEALEDGEEKRELIQLRDKLLLLVIDISKITVSLKVVYNTNLKIINEIKSKMVFAPSNKYGMDKSTVSLPSALHVKG